MRQSVWAKLIEMVNLAWPHSCPEQGPLHSVSYWRRHAVTQEICKKAEAIERDSEGKYINPFFRKRKIKIFLKTMTQLSMIFQSHRGS